MVSLLAEEVRARTNLAPVCQNLYETAAALGFEWKDERTDFRRVFRARVFDNRRTFVRDRATSLFNRDPSKTDDDRDDDAPPPFVRVESAARFGAEIPLEYAYAAWGLLRETSESNERERSQIRGFKGVSTEQIRDFARTRTRAMQRVERARFRFADADGGEVSVKDLGLLRLRIGDWVVLNPLADAEGRALPAWKLVRGRLAIVEEISASNVSLRLLPMNFKSSPFRYRHQLFAPE